MNSVRPSTGEWEYHSNFWTSRARFHSQYFSGISLLLFSLSPERRICRFRPAAGSLEIAQENQRHLSALIAGEMRKRLKVFEHNFCEGKGGCPLYYP
jgi:hypothetical protein